MTALINTISGAIEAIQTAEREAVRNVGEKAPKYWSKTIAKIEDLNKVLEKLESTETALKDLKRDINEDLSIKRESGTK